MAARRVATRRGPSPRDRFLPAVTLVVFVLLAATAEERTFGTVSDEQQMLYTAISMATSCEVGLARGQTFSIPRPGGDAVSPYGMGLPLLEAPLALLARPWEMRFGARTSQTLFVLLQVLLVTAAALGAGHLAQTLGAGRFGQGLAAFGTALGSPLWPYTASGWTEPLQAVGFVLAFLFAARAAQADATGAIRLAAAAGFSAGFLVLTKIVNVVFLPLVLLPLTFGAFPSPRERWKAWAAAAAGAAAPLAATLAFEVGRFGTPFSSYARGGGFTHPLLDGAWRLLVGPNKGLLLYFPLLLLGLAGLFRLGRRPEGRAPALAVAGLLAGGLVLYGKWWAWDGSGGWGPRLLVPLVPLLSAAAGVAATTPFLRAAAIGLLALGLGVNALGTFQVESATFFYVSSTGFARVSRALYEEYPPAFRPPPDRDGAFFLPRYVPAASDAAFSDLCVHPFLLSARLADLGDEARRERVLSPPWLASHPDAVPRLPPPSASLTTQTALVNYLTSPFRWPHLFMSFVRPDRERAGTFHPAWFAGLADQTLRNLDIGRPDRAARMAATLFALAPSGYAAALRLEGLRLSGESEAARRFLDSLPERVRQAPVVLLVQALRARDQGQEALASSLLAEAARGLRTPATREAVGRPPDEWPRALRQFLAEFPEGVPAVTIPAPPR